MSPGSRIPTQTIVLKTLNRRPRHFFVERDEMLNATSGLLMFVGPVVLLIGTLMFYVAAFRTSVVWGLVCLLLPPACPVFLIIHWGKAKRAFTVLLVALAIMFAGLALDISLDPGGLLDIAPRAPSGDYDLAGEIIKYEPDPAYVGDKVAFTYLVKNIGKDPVPALAYMVELYVDKERLRRRILRFYP
jgi:hypothetical protein